ncbi:EAL domain-containing protein [Vibrio sp. PP-XX7]
MERTRLEEQLRNALEREEFVCFYQPQVDSEGYIIGAEVLIRWRHPSMGMISPQVFIPLAEETGLIVPIGTWVLHQACARLKLWRQLPNAAHLTLAVNVSAVQFREADFIPIVEQAIHTYRHRSPFPEAGTDRESGAERRGRHDRDHEPPEITGRWFFHG